MLELREVEMFEVTGGGLGWGVLTFLGTVVVLVAGIISGYTNPSKCNN